MGGQGFTSASGWAATWRSRHVADLALQRRADCLSHTICSNQFGARLSAALPRGLGATALIMGGNCTQSIRAFPDCYKSVDVHTNRGNQCPSDPS